MEKINRLQLEQSIIHLKSELSQYKSKVQEYQEDYRFNKLKNLKIENLMLLKTIEKYKQQLKNTEDERKIIKTKVVELDEENKAYRIQLEETTTKYEKDLQDNFKVQQHLEEQIKLLQSEVEDLHEECTLQQLIQQKNETLDRELANYKARAEQEKELLQTKLADYENELNILKGRNEALERELEYYKSGEETERKLLQTKLTAYENELNILKGRNAALDKELKCYKTGEGTERKLLQTKLTAYENELNILKGRNTALDKELEYYKTEAETEKKLLQTKLIDNENELNILKDRNEALERELEDYKVATEKQIKLLHIKLTENENDQKKLQRENAGLTDEVENYRQKIEKQVSLEKEQKELITILTQKLNQFQTSQKNYETLQVKLKFKNKELNAEEQRRDAFQQELQRKTEHLASIQNTENTIEYQQIQKLVEQINEYGKNISQSVFLIQRLKREIVHLTNEMLKLEGFIY